jgi:hypothetical protein
VHPFGITSIVIEESELERVRLFYGEVSLSIKATRPESRLKSFSKKVNLILRKEKF